MTISNMRQTHDTSCAAADAAAGSRERSAAGTFGSVDTSSRAERTESGLDRRCVATVRRAKTLSSQRWILLIGSVMFGVSAALSTAATAQTDDRSPDDGRTGPKTTKQSAAGITVDPTVTSDHIGHRQSVDDLNDDADLNAVMVAITNDDCDLLTDIDCSVQGQYCFTLPDANYTTVGPYNIDLTGATPYHETPVSGCQDMPYKDGWYLIQASAAPGPQGHSTVPP